jgi:hypothetical protein
LEREGKSEVVKQELEKNAVYRSLLKELPVAKATSARVFLCGYPYAGKTVGVHQNIPSSLFIISFFISHNSVS